MTDLQKAVRRRTTQTVHDGGARRLVVTLHPSGILGLRLERSRREETIPLEFCYFAAVKARVLRERAEKRRGKA
jgi:hypothetical protein